MAHLGVKLPDDLMVDYQQKGCSEFQEGFTRMLEQETKRLRNVVDDLEGRQRQAHRLIESRVS